jgi:hypothetical protein
LLLLCAGGGSDDSDGISALSSGSFDSDDGEDSGEEEEGGDTFDMEGEAAGHHAPTPEASTPQPGRFSDAVRSVSGSDALRLQSMKEAVVKVRCLSCAKCRVTQGNWD